VKTLVVAPNWIGDAVMAQPLLTLLQRADPMGTIIVLAPRWVSPLFGAMPEVDDVIITDLEHGLLQWSMRRRYVEEVRNQGFDRAFVLPNSFKSALIPRMAGIKERIGYRGEARFGVINRRADDPDPGLSMSARYAALAGMAGIGVGLPLPTPRLIVDSATTELIRTRFGFDPESVLIALCPGAEYGPAQRWPNQHFADLASRLIDETPGVEIVLLGGSSDRAAGEAIVAAVRDPHVHNFIGLTSLAEAIALIAGASSVVSNDSGLMHVAAALSRPQVALFGSSDPRITPPLSPRARVLWLHLDCSPCFERVCPLGHLNCLVGITPELVIDSMRSSDDL
jgi:heptosyltransferase-2